MEIKVSTENGRVPVTIIHVDGNIDSSTYEMFLAKADELIENGAGHIIVDLAHAPYVSSAGLRALQHIYERLRSRNTGMGASDEEVKEGIRAGTYKSPHLKLLNPSKETMGTLETTGFDMYIDIFTDKAAALASF